MTQAGCLIEGASQIGIELSTDTRKKLLQYLALLDKWNRVFNLTAVRDPKQMVSHHLLDSMAVIPYLWPKRWLDVGCGGGLPGLVLAIVKPEWSLTLLDSNSKKTGFVQQVCIELGLKNVGVHCGRVEGFEQNVKFDGIISRAFAETGEFVALTRHLLAENGSWAAMKGVPAEELKRLPLGVVVREQIQLRVPGLDAARCLVVLKEEK